MASPHNLSPAQFQRMHADLVDPDNGGFTYKTHGPDAGQANLPAHVLRGNPEYSDVVSPGAGDDISPERIEQYAVSRSGALRQPDNYMGGWHSGETGDTYLDTTTAKPATPYNVAEALVRATMDGEESIGFTSPDGGYGGDEPTRLRTDASGKVVEPELRPPSYLAGAANPAIGPFTIGESARTAIRANSPSPDEIAYARLARHNEAEEIRARRRASR